MKNILTIAIFGVFIYFAYNFFKEDIILENRRARLEPLQLQHYTKLLPIALEKMNLEIASLTFSDLCLIIEEFLRTIMAHSN